MIIRKVVQRDIVVSSLFPSSFLQRLQPADYNQIGGLPSFAAALHRNTCSMQVPLFTTTASRAPQRGRVISSVVFFFPCELFLMMKSVSVRSFYVPAGIFFIAGTDDSNNMY